MKLCEGWIMLNLCFVCLFSAEAKVYEFLGPHINHMNTNATVQVTVFDMDLKDLLCDLGMMCRWVT